MEELQLSISVGISINNISGLMLEAIVRVPPVGVTFKSRYRPSDEDSDLHEFFDKDGKSQGLEQSCLRARKKQKE